MTMTHKIWIILFAPTESRVWILLNFWSWMSKLPCNYGTWPDFYDVISLSQTFCLRSQTWSTLHQFAHLQYVVMSVSTFMETEIETTLTSKRLLPTSIGKMSATEEEDGVGAVECVRACNLCRTQTSYAAASWPAAAAGLQPIAQTKASQEPHCTTFHVCSPRFFLIRVLNYKLY